MVLDRFSLKGKVAFITGASYGIGFAIAKAYVEAGAKIVFNDIRQDLVDKGLAAYAIGDCVQPRGIHEAIYEGHLTAKSI